MRERAEVRNAADPHQVRRAERKTRDDRARRRDSLAAVLATVDGRDLIWRLLADTGLFTSPLHASGSMAYYLIGRGDFGRELLAELVRDHGDAYLLMEQEARTREAQEARERAAAHTPRADEPT